MAKTFGSALAFRTSLEERLKREAAARGVPLNVLRLKLVIERLLARLFAEPDPPWLLKGGYAMELRYRPKARTTRDIDLTVGGALAATLEERLEQIREELQASAGRDLGDYMLYRVAKAKTELSGAPLGGARFPVEATLAGKEYGRFHIDVGFGDAVVGLPESLVGDDLLAFAGLEPAKVLALPKSQQFAEKVHAYTYQWTDRTNTRSKDLVDLLVLIADGLKPSQEVRSALRATFSVRATHPVPKELQAPPASWRDDFRSMAAETSLVTADLDEGFAILQRFWTEGELGGRA